LILIQIIVHEFQHAEVQISAFFILSASYTFSGAFATALLSENVIFRLKRFLKEAGHPVGGN